MCVCVVFVHCVTYPAWIIWCTIPCSFISQLCVVCNIHTFLKGFSLLVHAVIILFYLSHSMVMLHTDIINQIHFTLRLSSHSFWMLEIGGIGKYFFQGWYQTKLLFYLNSFPRFSSLYIHMYRKEACTVHMTWSTLNTEPCPTTPMMPPWPCPHYTRLSFCTDIIFLL